MNEAQQVYEMVSAGFTWQDDLITFRKLDYFKDFYKEVKAGKAWRGDCDDFALTCLAVGIKDFGWDKNDCLFLSVATRDCPPAWPFDHHMAQHGKWYFDNRQGYAIDYFPASYVAYAYQELPFKPGGRKLFKSGLARHAKINSL